METQVGILYLLLTLECSKTLKKGSTKVHINMSIAVEKYVKVMDTHVLLVRTYQTYHLLKKRILLRQKTTDTDGQTDLNSIRYDFLTQTEQLDTLRKKAEALEETKEQLFFIRSNNLRQEIQLRNTREKLLEYSSRGDMKAITHNFVKAQEKGLFKDKTTLLGTLESIAKNFHVKGPTGRRFHTSTRNFYEALLILGGPRIANFVAINMEGPNLNSKYKWRKLKSVCLKPGLDNDNFRQYALIIKGVMEVHKLAPSPVLAAKDETAIVGVVQYQQDRDELLGFCGPKTENPTEHKCLQSFHIPVGNNNRAYENIINAFQENKIGTHARVIILNPLQKRIPKLVALLMPTCNRFNHNDVYQQWQKILKLYQEHLETLLGPLIGNSSDGDSRRRKLHVQLMKCDAGLRYRPIPVENGFVFSARKEPSENLLAGYAVREIADQDPIHNHKKLINHLDHTSRMLYIGPELLVHMNHVERVLQTFPVIQHGLTRGHVRRDRDRQNLKIAQELSFKTVQDCIDRLITGTEQLPPDPSMKGTRAFLNVVYHYSEIFFSATESLGKTVTFAGFVTHFLAIWRNFIYYHQQLTLSANFLSRETYTDVLISTHFSVILICFFRDNFPELKCELGMVGSDCCEEFFSKNGQFVGNHHVYPYAQMFRNLRHMIRLNQIEVDDNAPAFAKAHIKQQNVWHRETPGGVTCSLTDYPLVGSEVDLWNDGVIMARDLARSLGMGPEFYNADDPDDPHDPDNGWFFKPFDYGGHEKLFKDLSGGRDCGDDCGGDDDENDENNQHDLRGHNSDDVPDEQDSDGLPCDIDRQFLFKRTKEEEPILQDVLVSMVDNVEIDDDGCIEREQTKRGEATVLVPGHGEQYKSTIVKLLNEEPNLSKDRLVRVRQIQIPNETENTENRNNESGLSLFDDYAYLDKTEKNF